MHKIALAFDFETSKLVEDFSMRSDDPRQPHIVQAACSLIDMETRAAVDSYEALSKWEGWEVQPEAFAIHGITAERALAEGIFEGDIVHKVYSMWKAAQIRIAFNKGFDNRIMRIGLKRFMGEKQAEVWSEGSSHCAMQMSRKLVGLPKTPSLAEAYRHFFGEDVPNAHTAAGDRDAMMRVYWACIDQGVDPEAKAAKPATSRPRAAKTEKMPAPAPAPAPVLGGNGTEFL